MSRVLSGWVHVDAEAAHGVVQVIYTKVEAPVDGNFSFVSQLYLSLYRSSCCCNIELVVRSRKRKGYCNLCAS